MSQASKTWSLSDNPNKIKLSAICRKDVIYFWQSVDAILEAKTIFDANLLIKRLQSFSVPKTTVIRHM